MLNLNTTDDNRLSLTEQELQILSDVLATQDRAGRCLFSRQLFSA